MPADYGCQAMEQTKSTDRVRQASYAAIKRGSLSFNFAAQLLAPDIRDDVVRLYAWCRWLDDLADATGSHPEAKAAVIAEAEHRSFLGRDLDDDPIAVTGFKHLLRKHAFPEQYARELIAGMRMDLCHHPCADFDHLKKYCYHVAGVVGIMLAYVMRVRDVYALKHACDLGIAMQLTNIARDVLTDASMGRVYLPVSMLARHGIKASPAAIESPENREAVFSVVKDLLSRADGFYQSGDSGLKYLPFRAALSVVVAREVYADIGRMVLEHNTKAWDKRLWVPTWRKLFLAFRGLTRLIRHLPFRLTRKPLLSETIR